MGNPKPDPWLRKGAGPLRERNRGIESVVAAADAVWEAVSAILGSLGTMANPALEEVYGRAQGRVQGGQQHPGRGGEKSAAGTGVGERGGKTPPKRNSGDRRRVLAPEAVWQRPDEDALLSADDIRAAIEDASRLLVEVTGTGGGRIACG